MWKILIRLSHEPGTMYMNDMCSKSDIEWLRNFHERILKREDPIALIFCHSAGLISCCKNPNFFNNKTDRCACRFVCYFILLRYF